MVSLSRRGRGDSIDRQAEECRDLTEVQGTGSGERSRHVGDFVIHVEFSDGSSGEYDLAPLVARDTALTRPWQDRAFFQRFFTELGALAWPNGLELSAESVQRRLDQAGKLRRPVRVA
jgi:hypothetical protein